MSEVSFRQYDGVRMGSMDSDRAAAMYPDDQRAPRVGDVATIVEIYTGPVLGYELECVAKDGLTIWLRTFSAGQVGLTLVWRAVS